MEKVSTDVTRTGETNAPPPDNQEAQATSPEVADATPETKNRDWYLSKYAEIQELEKSLDEAERQANQTGDTSKLKELINQYDQFTTELEQAMTIEETKLEGLYANGFWRSSEGFARVATNNGKYNFIDKNGNLLSDIEFDFATDFSKGFAKVAINGKRNFIDKNGNLLSDTGFDYAYAFSEGFATVKINGKPNFIDKNGNLLSDTGFDEVENFSEGFALVKINDKWNFIDTTGKLVFDIGFDEYIVFEEDLALALTRRGDDAYLLRIPWRAK